MAQELPHNKRNNTPLDMIKTARIPRLCFDCIVKNCRERVESAGRAKNHPSWCPARLFAEERVVEAANRLLAINGLDAEHHADF